MLILVDWIKPRVFGRDIAIYSQGDEGASPAAAPCTPRAPRGWHLPCPICAHRAAS